MNKQQYFEIEVNSYIDKLMNNLWNETLIGNKKTIFFNTKNSNVFSQYIDSYLQNISQEVEIFRERINKTNFTTPYYPFLDFIKETMKLKNSEEIREFVEKADVYYFQKSIFLSYFYEKPIQRAEEVILGEVLYEKDRMLQSIVSLYFSMCHNAPMIVVIEDLHYAKKSTLELIKHIIRKKEKKKIFFIFSFNKEYQFETEEGQKNWEEFIEYLQTYDSIVEGEFEESKNTVNIKEDYCRRFKEEQILGIEEIIDLSLMSFYFFALQECKEYITAVYNQIIITNKNLTPIYFSKMLRILANVHFYLEENDTSLMYYNSLLNLSQKSKEVKEMSYCYEKIAFIYWRKGNIKRAERLAGQSLQFALELQDEMLIFNSKFLLFLIGGRGKEKAFEQWKGFYYDSVEIAKKFSMKNILAYCYTHPFLIYFQSEEERTKFYDLGISIAKKFNNKYRLSAAYHSQGIFYNVKGSYDKALKYYKKSESLKLELGYKLEITYIYNGLGFYYFVRQNYEKASFYYYKALEYLRNLENYNETATTLFNIAYNYSLALQPRLSIQYLEKLIPLINILKMDAINYHTLFGIYALIGINYCNVGEISKAYEYMIKIKEIRTACYLDDDKFLVALFEALLSKIEENYEKSTFHFNEAMLYIQKLKYEAPRFYYEYGLMKKEQGKKVEAERLFKMGIQYCEELQYSFYKSLLLRELGELKDIQFPFESHNKFSDLQWIIDSVKQKLTINNLNKKINEINFLNILQEIIGREKNKEELIKNVINLIHDSFLMECSFLYLREEKKWNCVYYNEAVEVSNLDCFPLPGILTKERKITVIPNVRESLKYRELGNKFYSIINIPLVNNNELIGNILCATKKEEMIINYDDIKILSMTAKQLVNALKKLKKDDLILQKEKELYEANEYDRLKTEFLCNLSHEFRTPLNVMLGTLQLLGLSTKQHKERKYLQIMKQNCYRLVRLVNNLIDISKFDSGFYKTKFENHNIVNIIEEITLSVAPYIEQKGISLQFDTNVEEKIMGCDADQMERVILNLLSNSVKFTKPGGKIKVNFYDKGKNVLIVIKDTGIGIPKNKLHIIFKRFGQVDKSLTRNHEGSGIGLSLVKSIVETWGGNISIESEYGKGSTFTIELPVTVLPGSDLYQKEKHNASLDLVEKIQVEFSDIYF